MDHRLICRWWTDSGAELLHSREAENLWRPRRVFEVHKGTWREILAEICFPNPRLERKQDEECCLYWALTCSPRPIHTSETYHMILSFHSAEVKKSYSITLSNAPSESRSRFSMLVSAYPILRDTFIQVQGGKKQAYQIVPRSRRVLECLCRG